MACQKMLEFETLWFDYPKGIALFSQNLECLQYPHMFGSLYMACTGMGCFWQFIRYYIIFMWT